MVRDPLSKGYALGGRTFSLSATETTGVGCITSVTGRFASPNQIGHEQDSFGRCSVFCEVAPSRQFYASHIRPMICTRQLRYRPALERNSAHMLWTIRISQPTPFRTI